MRYIVKQRRDKMYYVTDTRLNVARRGFDKQRDAETEASALNLKEQLFNTVAKDSK